MPIHIMSILQLSKGILKNLNKLLSSFFGTMFKPNDDGGIGIRDFDEVQTSLHMKFAWKVMTGDELWSQLFHAKYIGDKYVSLLDPKKGTRFWKMVVKCMLVVLDNSKWKVHDENISFWWDHWLNEGSLANFFPMVDVPRLMLAKLRISNGWEIEVLERLVGLQKMKEIFSFLGAHKFGQDLLVLIPNKDGCFSTKSAWQCIQVTAPATSLATWVWHEGLPKQISILMWKAFHNSLSVDDRLRRVGIPITSKCNCCAQGRYKDLNHVLTIGDFASRIWKKFSLILGVPYEPNRRWFELVLLWFRRASTKFQVGCILGLFSFIIIWKLWQRRYKARMEGKCISEEKIWRSIFVWIRKVQSSLPKFTKIAFVDEERLRDLNIPIISIQFTPVKLVCWVKLRPGIFKLNTDGCSLSNQGSLGAGGVIRDLYRDMVLSFSCYLEVGSNNLAELKALVIELKYCRSLV
ncbi:hypothetical protein I3760_01G021900 [Carya illinoinensis]|nr:hypothetical protein I3760_01G021900 [Carya illinoinensis]